MRRLRLDGVRAVFRWHEDSLVKVAMQHGNHATASEPCQDPLVPSTRNSEGAKGAGNQNGSSASDSRIVNLTGSRPPAAHRQLHHVRRVAQHARRHQSARTGAHHIERSVRRLHPTPVRRLRNHQHRHRRPAHHRSLDGGVMRPLPPPVRVQHVPCGASAAPQPGQFELHPPGPVVTLRILNPRTLSRVRAVSRMLRASSIVYCGHGSPTRLVAAANREVRVDRPAGRVTMIVPCW